MRCMMSQPLRLPELSSRRIRSSRVPCLNRSAVCFFMPLLLSFDRSGVYARVLSTVNRSVGGRSFLLIHSYGLHYFLHGGQFEKQNQTPNFADARGCGVAFLRSEEREREC